jgi:hypothetical protein
MAPTWPHSGPNVAPTLVATLGAVWTVPLESEACASVHVSGVRVRLRGQVRSNEATDAEVIRWWAWRAGNECRTPKCPLTQRVQRVAGASARVRQRGQRAKERQLVAERADLQRSCDGAARHRLRRCRRLGHSRQVRHGEATGRQRSHDGIDLCERKRVDGRISDNARCSTHIAGKQASKQAFAPATAAAGCLAGRPPRAAARAAARQHRRRPRTLPRPQGALACAPSPPAAACAAGGRACAGWASAAAQRQQRHCRAARATSPAPVFGTPLPRCAPLRSSES